MRLSRRSFVCQCLSLPLVAHGVSACSKCSSKPEHQAPVDGDDLTQSVALEGSTEWLKSLEDALNATQRQEASTHLVFYGGSHTASDLLTGSLRRAWQERFGDAGHGFLLPVPTMPEMWQQDVAFVAAQGFAIERPSSQRTQIEGYGACGIRFVGSQDAHARIKSTGTSTRAEVFVRSLPKKPATRMLLKTFDPNGRELASQRLDTQSSASSCKIAIARDQEIEISVEGTEASALLGVSLDSETLGVRIDNYGLVGGKARHFGFWEETEWAALLSARAPHLIALAYGTNEAEDKHLSYQEHEQHFANTLARIRKHFPQVSLLVIGPTFRRKDDENEFVQRMNESQRRLAHEHAALFFNTQAMQGGTQGFERWKANPAWLRSDGIHWEEQAYQRWGARVSQALLNKLGRS